MSEVNSTNLNASQAYKIAENLDAQDGNKDGKINASIWNNFVEGKEGKEIKYSITLTDAVRSISTYLKKMASSTGKTIEQLATEWKKPSQNTQQTSDTRNKTTTKNKTDDLVKFADDKVKETFRKANQFLVDVSNMNPKPKITSGTVDRYQSKKATLDDGRWIKVYYDSSGNIKSIMISYDTSRNQNINQDTPEVTYDNYSGAKCDIPGEDRTGYDIDWVLGDGRIDRSQYNFEELCKIAEKIFGPSTNIFDPQDYI